jgi:serine O-acetyltransferase
MSDSAQHPDALEQGETRPRRFENIRADYDAYLFASWTWIPDYQERSELSRRLERWEAIVFRGLWPSVVLYRLDAWARRRGIPLLPVIADILNRFLFGVVIGKNVEIGPGFCISHGSVVIDGVTRIGKNCSINPYVTIGLSTSSKVGLSLRGPTIGDNVYIGTGARVLGPVKIGDNAKIGANAVVLTDVPDNHTAVGVPARVIPQRPPWKEDDREGEHPPGPQEGED